MSANGEDAPRAAGRNDPICARTRPIPEGIERPVEIRATSAMRRRNAGVVSKYLIRGIKRAVAARSGHFAAGWEGTAQSAPCPAMGGRYLQAAAAGDRSVACRVARGDCFEH